MPNVQGRKHLQFQTFWYLPHTMSYDTTKVIQAFEGAQVRFKNWHCTLLFGFLPVAFLIFNRFQCVISQMKEDKLLINFITYYFWVEVMPFELWSNQFTVQLLFLHTVWWFVCVQILPNYSINQIGQIIVCNTRITQFPRYKQFSNYFREPLSFPMFTRFCTICYWQHLLSKARPWWRNHDIHCLIWSMMTMSLAGSVKFLCVITGPSTCRGVRSPI